MFNSECQVGSLRYGKTRLRHSAIVANMKVNDVTKALLGASHEAITCWISGTDNIR
jgi:hypothetical protein